MRLNSTIIPYLLVLVKLLPNVVRALCSFEKEKASSGKICGNADFGPWLLYWRAGVQQTRRPYIRLISQQIVRGGLEVDFWDLLLNGEAVVIGHVYVATAYAGYYIWSV
jgi:hypothetical protein